ncbi:MAG: protein translocase subunit SecF [Candidatus Porifericomitaceae bacterium WSBS_2022_MAG_OTU9]
MITSKTTSRKVIQFMRFRKLLPTVSLILIFASVTLLATRGLNLGIDFTGGTLVEVTFAEPTSPQQIRELLLTTKFEDASVQGFGKAGDILVRLPITPGSENSTEIASRLSDSLLQIFRSEGLEVNVRRVEFVGPQVGRELTESGAWALLYALGGILVYVALRFQLRFSVGAIVALIHDVVLTLGIFSLLQLSFDLSVLAAVLAIIGYSLNDTIVIYDRVRDNFRIMHKANPIEVIDASLTQTLTRTLVTSSTTLLVLFALFFIGGEIIRPFTSALLIGIFIGTYSSMYIANPAILLLGISRKDLLPIEKHGAESSGIVT